MSQYPIRKRVEELKDCMPSFGRVLYELQQSSIDHKKDNKVIEPETHKRIWESYFKDKLPNYRFLDFGNKDIYIRYETDGYASIVNERYIVINIFVTKNIVIRCYHSKNRTENKITMLKSTDSSTTEYKYQEFKKEYDLNIPDDVMDLTEDHLLLIKLAV